MANRINQNNCFASHKDEDWCTQSEMSERVVSCYVLKEEHFGKMKRLGFCGTKAVRVDACTQASGVWL